MLGKHVIFPFSSINYMFSVNYIFLLNFTYVFAIITCLGFLVHARTEKTLAELTQKFGYKIVNHNSLKFNNKLVLVSGRFLINLSLYNLFLNSDEICGFDSMIVLI